MSVEMSAEMSIVRWGAVWGALLAWGASTAPGQDAGTPDLRYVLPEAAVVAVAQPRALLTSKALDLLPRELFSAGSVQQTGLDVMDIEQLVVFATPPAGGPPAYGVIARFRKDIPLPTAPGEAVDIEGRPGLQFPGPGAPLVTHADSKTLIVAPQTAIAPMLTATGPRKALADVLRAASRPTAVLVVADVASLRPLAAAALRQAPPLPPPVQGLTALPQNVDLLAVQADVESSRVNLLLRSADPDAAGKAKAAIKEALEFGKSIATSGALEQFRGDERMRDAMSKYLERVSTALISQLTPRQSGADLRLSLKSDYTYVGVMVGLLLPAVQAAREAARRASAANQLKQIGIALLSYHDVHNALPARYSTRDGKPLLSWRVHILPYLDEQRLYEQFHLDEPWDSPHNRTLIDKIPSVYSSPNRKVDGKTVYLASEAEGGLLSPTEPTPFSKVTDGLSNTIMCVEADSAAAVIWTKPGDLPYNNKQPMQGLGHMRPGGFQVLAADAAVRFVSTSIDPDVLRGLLTRAGREDVRFDR